jgi:2-keto-3-deoxy-L-rhamnonate aldolase RhmA
MQILKEFTTCYNVVIKYFIWRQGRRNCEMIENTVRKALIERKLTIGSWIQIGHPVVAEILANAGFDWIAADCEHTDIDIKGFAEIARGMHGRGAVPMIRVRENDTLAIRQALDLGAQGVIVPLVNTAEQARKAVMAAKYPPQGIRGFCFSRMNNWGVDFDEYAKKANENIAVVVMIESKEAVENIDEILEVKGVDGVFIGPYDMSGSFGVVGQTGHTLILDACKTVVKACNKHSKAAGLHIVKPTPESIEKALEDGFTFIALGVDTVFLNHSASAALMEVKKFLK